MAGPKQWGEVRLRWQTALAQFGVEVFHMTDFENRQGEFRGWDETQKRALLSELMHSFEDDLWYFIGASAVVRDFNRLPLKVPLVFQDPWYFCYQNCFQEALTPDFIFDPEFAGVEREYANIRACFFEEHRQFKWGPVLFALAHETDRKRGISRRAGIVGWGSKKTSVHFQLADLVAYELRKHVENAVFSEGRQTRWPMQQLLKKAFIVNILDDSRTPIPTDGNKFALFRTASLGDVDENGRIRFNAPQV